MMTLCMCLNQANVTAIQIKFNNKSQTGVICVPSGSMLVCGGKYVMECLSSTEDEGCFLVHLIALKTVSNISKLKSIYTPLGGFQWTIEWH